MKKSNLFLLIFLLFLFIPIHASAGIIDTVTLNAGHANDKGTFHFPNLGTKDVYDNYNANISGGAVIPADYYEIFCVEDAWSNSNNQYTVLSIDSDLIDFGLTPTDYYRAAWIAENYYNVDKEAAQIAVWEVMFDTGYDIYNDSFYYISGVYPASTLTNAQNYLVEVKDLIFSDDFSTNWVLAVNPTIPNDTDGTDVVLKSSQNYIFRINPVQEPATLLLLGTGLIGLAGLGRKKFIKNQEK